MSMIAQVCIVILTLSLVVTAIMVWRALKRFEALAQKISLGVDEARRATSEAQQVIATLQHAAKGIHRSTSQFEEISGRITRLSALVIDEIERPARSAAALAEGVRAGAAALLGRRASMVTTHHFNGGKRHV